MASDPHGRSVDEIIRIENEVVNSGNGTDSEKERLRTVIQGGEVFKRAQGRVWIKDNPIYGEVLEDIKEQKQGFNGKLEASERRSAELTNQIFNLVGFFSVFQGVILTAVTQLAGQSTAAPAANNSLLCPSRPPVCRKVWFPVALSVLAAFVAIVGIGVKFRDLYRTEEDIRGYKGRITALDSRYTDIHKQGNKFLFHTIKDYSTTPLNKIVRIFNVGAVVGAVIAFTVIFSVSYYVILCDKFMLP